MRLHQALKDVFLHLSSRWKSSFNECGKILIHVRIMLLCIHIINNAHLEKISKKRKHLVTLSHILLLSIQDSILPSFTLVAIARATQVRKWGSIQQSCSLNLPSSLHISTLFLWAWTQFHTLFSFVVIFFISCFLESATRTLHCGLISSCFRDPSHSAASNFPVSSKKGFHTYIHRPWRWKICSPCNGRGAALGRSMDWNLKVVPTILEKAAGWPLATELRVRCSSRGWHLIFLSPILGMDWPQLSSFLWCKVQDLSMEQPLWGPWWLHCRLKNRWITCLTRLETRGFSKLYLVVRLLSCTWCFRFLCWNSCDKLNTVWLDMLTWLSTIHVSCSHLQRPLWLKKRA